MPAIARYLAIVLATAVLALAGGCASQPARLDGPSWRLVAWSISSQPASDFEITARFADGGVSGRSAVNTYRATATIGPGNTLAVGPVAMTRMAGPEPAMRAEKAYLELLGDAATWRIESGQLTLLDSRGIELLVFARGED